MTPSYAFPKYLSHDSKTMTRCNPNCQSPRKMATTFFLNSATKCLISAAKYLTSTAKCLIYAATSLISAAKCLISATKCRISAAKRLISAAKCLTSAAKCPISRAMWAKLRPILAFVLSLKCCGPRRWPGSTWIQRLSER